MPITTIATPSAPSGSATSSQLELFPADMWTSEASPMSTPATSEAFDNAISSPASAAGPTPFSWPDGPATENAGLPAFPANPIQAQDSGAAPLMNEISGQFSFGWSSGADPQSSSESKSPVPSSLARLRKCRVCGEGKPSSAFRKHNKGGLRGICRDCENTSVREAKPWQSERKQAYQRERRRTHRGFVLTNEAKRRSLEKGIPFDLEWRNIQERIDLGLCEVTGIPFSLDEPKAWNAPSLDQIQPSAGYTKENTRVVLYALNTMANNWGFEIILKVADAVRARQSVSASNVLSRKIYERLRQTLPGSTEYDLTWRTQVTPSGHVLYQLVPSMRRTSDKDFSGWPTPTRQDQVQSGVRDYPATETHHSGTTLATPTSRDHKDAASTLENTPVNSLLGRQVQSAGWPTPTSALADKGVRSETGGIIEAMRSRGPDLAAVATLAGWATPRANKWGEPDSHGRTAFGSPAPTEKRGALNPNMSRFLMGFPAIWDLSAPRKK